jgi:hypothetical protein
MTNPLEFFATAGPMTSHGNQAPLLDALPGDIQSLVKVVQGLMIHIFWVESYGVTLTDSRREEVQMRPAALKFERIIELDRRPLVEPREPEKRLVGNCRDFSVLLTAMLRYQGVPARARCGFGRYLIPHHYEDHWVVEYWNASQQRWVLVDAQLDELQCRELAIQFDPLDVPRGQFVVGGKAWQLCRTGQVDPEKFGIFDMKGLWFVRGNFIRDAASLNKVELLPWDSWGIIESTDKGLTPQDLDWLDNLAVLTCGDVPKFDRVRELYEGDDRLKVPTTIRSYTQAGMQEVDLGQIDL